MFSYEIKMMAHHFYVCSLTLFTVNVQPLQRRFCRRGFKATQTFFPSALDVIFFFGARSAISREQENVLWLHFWAAVPRDFIPLAVKEIS